MNKNSLFDIIKKFGEVAKNMQNAPAVQNDRPKAQPTQKTYVQKNLVSDNQKQPTPQKRVVNNDAVVKMINEHNRLANIIKTKN